MQGVVFTGERGLEMMHFPDPTPGPGRGGGGDEGLRHVRFGPAPVPPPEEPGAPMPPACRPIPTRRSSDMSLAAWSPRSAPTCCRPRRTIGQRVMVHHYQGCTQCGHCRSGWQQLCQEVPVKVYGNNSHGGHAKYLLVPANTLVPLPDELTFSAGAAIACGSGTAYGALRRMNISGRDTIAIFGQGPVGLAGTQFAKAMGARVIALDVNPQRLARAKEFGADEVVDPGSNDPVAAIKDLTDGRYADLTLDTSSNPEARLNAIRIDESLGHDVLRRRGRRRPDRCQPASAAPAVDAGRVLDVLQHHPGGVRDLLCRTEDRCGQAVHAPLDAGSGRGGVQAVRQAVGRQGRVPDLMPDQARRKRSGSTTRWPSVA